jgi:hypothetical protein
VFIDISIFFMNIVMSFIIYDGIVWKFFLEMVQCNKNVNALDESKESQKSRYKDSERVLIQRREAFRFSDTSSPSFVDVLGPPFLRGVVEAAPCLKRLKPCRNTDFKPETSISDERCLPIREP